MARSARQRSNSRVYHSMFCGNELRDIFIDDEDRNKFLSTFKEKSECENFSVYAYCLMEVRGEKLNNITNPMNSVVSLSSNPYDYIKNPEAAQDYKYIVSQGEKSLNFMLNKFAGS